VQQNKDERYQVLQNVPLDADALGIGVVALGIDFKRYFTLPTAEVYRQLELRLENCSRRTVLLSPYLEHFSVRASGFQCRVALPIDHLVTQNTAVR